MEENEIKTIEDVDNLQTEKDYEELSNKYNETLSSYSKLQEDYNRLLQEKTVLLQENNRLYQRITTAPQPAESELDNILKSL